MMNKIETDTALLPDVIADSVAQEAAGFLDSPVPHEYVDRLTERAETIYAANARFRKKLRGRGDSGRDWLYTFMRHWLSAMLHEGHPDLFRRLPRSFSMGRAPAL